MPYSLLKFTVDLYAPQAVIRPREMSWIAKWGQFHSRRMVYPSIPVHKLVDLEDGVWIANQDFMHIRVTSMDGEYGGSMDSEFDFLLANTKLDSLLRSEIQVITQKALLKAPPYNPVHRTHVAWLELWEADEDTNMVESVAWGFEFKDIADFCLQSSRSLSRHSGSTQNNKTP